MNFKKEYSLIIKMNQNNKRPLETSNPPNTGLSEPKKSHIFSQPNPPPFTTIGLFTLLRTYCRRHEENNPKSTVESWSEVLERVVLACNTQLKVNFSQEELKELYGLLYNLKCSVAGRFLWQLGTSTVDRLGLPSLQNCFRRDTRFLTKEGVKSFLDFEDGDKVIIKGNGKWQTATVKNFGKQKLFLLTVNCNGALENIYTTQDHRWILADGKIVDTYSLFKNQLLKSTFVDIIWKVESITPTNIIEDVWCVSEPKEEFFTLANGIITKNCAATVIDGPVDPFTWVMNLLMLGAGCGYRLLPEDVAVIPTIKYALVTRKDTKDADFIVPDSREGWVKLLGKVLKAHFYSGENFTYSCTLLRSKGAPIKGFGGLASGPEVLCDGMAKINSLLNKLAGQKLRPVDALDIMNIIGMIVVSG